MIVLNSFENRYNLPTYTPCNLQPANLQLLRTVKLWVINSRKKQFANDPFGYRY